MNAARPLFDSQLWPLRLVLPGAPRTKKNHGRIVPRGRRRILLPSEAWQSWCDALAPQLSAAMQRQGLSPIDRPVNCRALFYRDADRGDAVGYFQGLADVLEHGGVVANDKYLTSWDGSRLRIDRARPRVELELIPQGED
jgi:hypothetical protein